MHVLVSSTAKVDQNNLVRREALRHLYIRRRAQGDGEDGERGWRGEGGGRG